jgi:tetratricopeptide (TPR) repeat protein
MVDASNKSQGSIRSAPPPDPRALIARAQQLQGAGRIDEAIAVYRDLLLQQPASADAHFLLGVALARKRDSRGAEEHIARAVALRPGSADFQHGLGLHYMHMKKLPEAIDCFRKAVTARPDFALAHNNLGTALRRSGDLQGALACWRTAFRLKRSLNAPQSDLETFTVVSRTKLRHDIDQLRHLRSGNLLPQTYDGTIAAYEKVLASLPDGPDAPAFFRLGREHRQLIGATYNRLVNLLPLPAHESSAVNPDLPSRDLEAAYTASGPGIVHVDGLLTPRAVADLRRFCLESTIWYDFKHEGGYLGAYINEGFDCGLLLQIAEELPKALPGIFAGHRLTQMWAYKYDSKLEGIGLHADAAAINVNFWITPDEANLDPDHGGLVVYDREAPADWDFAKFNKNLPAIRQFLGESGSRAVTVPYRQNRAVIFNSDLFHNTDRFAFAPGYENRRINVTMLFGNRHETA